MSAMNPRQIHVGARGNGATARHQAIRERTRTHHSLILRPLVWLRRLGLDRALAAAPLDRLAIRGSRLAPRRLAHDLCASETIRAQGVARVRLLLVDAGSPLFDRSDPAVLAREVAAAQDTLLVR